MAPPSSPGCATPPRSSPLVPAGRVPRVSPTERTQGVDRRSGDLFAHAGAFETTRPCATSLVPRDDRGVRWEREGATVQRAALVARGEQGRPHAETKLGRHVSEVRDDDEALVRADPVEADHVTRRLRRELEPPLSQRLSRGAAREERAVPREQ